MIISFTALLCAQTRPKIAAVVSAADFQPGVTFSGYASVFGSGLSDGEYRAEGSPYPQKLGTTQVFLCYSAPIPASQAANIITLLGCVPAPLVYASPSQINLVIHAAATLAQKPVGFDGRYIFIVSVGGMIDQDALAGTPIRYDLALPKPRIFSMGTDCLIDSRFQNRSTLCGLTFNPLSGNRADRGAITDAQGRVLTSSNPAKLGLSYSIWLTGMGTFQNGKPAVPPTMLITNIPVYGYAGDTWTTVTPEYVGASGQFPGLYQMNFTLPLAIATGHPSGYPPRFPCGDYNWEVSIDLSQGSSFITNHANLVQIPIALKSGEVPCVAP
jgi:hypothetical protein